jgi:hypothetical protein
MSSLDGQIDLLNFPCPGMYHLSICSLKCLCHSHHRSPKTELLLCPRSVLFRQDSVPALVISQVARKWSLAVDPMHRAVLAYSNRAL